MSRSPTSRISREFDELDQWRFADIRLERVKKGRRTFKETVYSTPLFEPTLNTVREWSIVIKNPDGEDKDVNIEMTFPHNYPFVPPEFKVTSAYRHSCIDRDGNLRLFCDSWSPAFTAGACLLIVCSTLFPNWVEKMEENRQQSRTDLFKMELFERTGAAPESIDVY